MDMRVMQDLSDAFRVENPIDDSFLRRARRGEGSSFSGPVLIRRMDTASVSIAIMARCHALGVSVSDDVLRKHELLNGRAVRLAVVERVAQVDRDLALVRVVLVAAHEPSTLRQPVRVSVGHGPTLCGHRVSDL